MQSQGFECSRNQNKGSKALPPQGLPEEQEDKGDIEMAVFVNKEAAKNLAANQIAIKKSVVAVDRPAMYQGFLVGTQQTGR
jgi:peptide deformylase